MIVKRGGGSTDQTGGGVTSKIHNRLLLPMSIFDIVNSLALGASTMPIPRGSPCTYEAIGNQTTCAIQGFMMKIGLCSPMYHAMLCRYYYCVLERNMNDRCYTGKKVVVEKL